MARSAFYLSVPAGGARFCLLTEPPAEPLGGLLYIHPFAEEMNKSRRMAALAAEAFAARGWRVLQPDLAGCGDSSGDFGDASWDGWIEDIDAAWQWLAQRTPGGVGLWGLRAGALLLADWLARRGRSGPMLLWQPVASGSQHLAQFLRLKAVSRMLAETEAGAATADLRQRLRGGQAVDVAGYTLSPALAQGMEAARLELPADYGERVAVLELTAADRVAASPALERLAARWGGRGIDVRLETRAGPAFWQTQEIETCPALIDASLSALGEWGLRCTAKSP